MEQLGSRTDTELLRYCLTQAASVVDEVKVDAELTFLDNFVTHQVALGGGGGAADGTQPQPEPQRRLHTPVGRPRGPRLGVGRRCSHNQLLHRRNGKANGVHKAGGMCTSIREVICDCDRNVCVDLRFFCFVWRLKGFFLYRLKS